MSIRLPASQAARLTDTCFSVSSGGRVVANITPAQYEIVAAKVVLLFGAGASYGAMGISPYAPPLGFDLFGRLRKAFPNTLGKVSDEVADIFDNNGPEKGMEALDDDAYEHRWDLVQLIRDMAIYFSRFQIQDISQNLYCRFVQMYTDRILGREMLLSTLNYECLIEYALGHYGIDTTYISADTGWGYQSSRSWAVISLGHAPYRR